MIFVSITISISSKNGDGKLLDLFVDCRFTQININLTPHYYIKINHHCFGYICECMY